MDGSIALVRDHFSWSVCEEEVAEVSLALILARMDDGLQIDGGHERTLMQGIASTL